MSGRPGMSNGRGARGVRLNPAHDERTRARIQTTQIIKRLQAFIFSQVELQPAQVTAALGLLRKTIPDLAAIEHGGEVKQIFAVSPELPTTEEWLAEFGEPKQLDS
jgi:hypothetical protein